MPPPHVSDLMRGRARGVFDRTLMQFLAALGYDLESRIKPQTWKHHGDLAVVAA
jgi:hypothetical protein